MPGAIADELNDNGFVVLKNIVPADAMSQLVAAYENATTTARPEDVHVGKNNSNTRVGGLVNRPDFDHVYIHPLLLAASDFIIQQPFKLSTIHSRTVWPGAAAQDLHVDFAADTQGWPMLGFIIMIDEFKSENAPTRFVPGSHRWSLVPDSSHVQLAARGPAGSAIIYNGSVWHGYSANRTDEPRRSIQGAYIRRSEKSANTYAKQISPETFDRIGDHARYLLDVSRKLEG